jgi:hypothetical protein
MHNGWAMIVTNTKPKTKPNGYWVKTAMGAGASGGPLFSSGKLVATAKESGTDLLTDMHYVPITPATIRTADRLARTLGIQS